jgi:hypothetical protein
MNHGLCYQIANAGWYCRMTGKASVWAQAWPVYNGHGSTRKDIKSAALFFIQGARLYPARWEKRILCQHLYLSVFFRGFRGYSILLAFAGFTLQIGKQRHNNAQAGYTSRPARVCRV